MSSTRERVVVIGASGHAKVVIELLRATERYEIAGCVDPKGSGDVLGAPVLGGDDVLPQILLQGVFHAFVAIGDNALRRAVFARVRALGFGLVAAVSPRATISPSARIGEGVAIMGGVTVNALARIGDGAIVNTNASIDHDCEVGAFVHCAPGTHLAGNVTIGEGAFLGVGVNAIPGVRIGAWSVLGAGATVVCDIPPNVTAVGVPARPLGART